MTERVAVGRVGKPHGLDGSFVVDVASEDDRWFAVGSSLLVGGDELRVVASKRAGGRPVVKLDSHVPRGAVLEVSRESLPATGEDEYYAFELVGLEVVLEVVEEGDGVLGRVSAVTSGVANDVLELDSGLALPMVDACVRRIDLETRRILVAPGFSDSD
jgi:16S rRNA processing protein RimM